MQDQFSCVKGKINCCKLQDGYQAVNYQITLGYIELSIDLLNAELENLVLCEMNKFQVGRSIGREYKERSADHTRQRARRASGLRTPRSPS